MSRYGLLKETIRVFLAKLRKGAADRFDEIAGRLSKEYLDKTFDLTEKDREKAQRRIREMAQDMYSIIEEFRCEEEGDN